MSELKADLIEIIGMNGVPAVECGRSLPIARRKADGFTCVLEISETVQQWESPERSQEYLGDGRWTSFKTPLPVPKSCVDQSNGVVSVQPMALFENDMLLDFAARRPRYDQFDGEYLQWRALLGPKEGYWGTCASEGVVERILNDWSKGLIQRFDSVHAQLDRDDLRPVADFALCAARSKELRWQAYLRYALCLPADRLNRTFKRFIQPEFPKLTWESFSEELSRFRDSLNLVFPPAISAVPVEAATTQKSKKLGRLAGVSRAATSAPQEPAVLQ